MPSKLIAQCSIYENRPDVCKQYPQVYHYVPEECTYWFAGSERVGRCKCDVGACCNIPREGGLPGGAPLPEEAGGAPCKYLTWDEVSEKEAADRPILASQNDWVADLEAMVDGDS
jgi:Fe-S-cluster containining protein